MRGLCRSGIVILLALVFGALPFAAAADNLSCGVASAAAPIWMARPGGGGGGVSEQSTCVANCGGGTSVSTICGGTCTAVDTNCPFAGYVTCNGVVTSSCPVCLGSGPDCQQTNGTSCSPVGSTMSCSPADGGTYTCKCKANHLWLCPY
jgi:hypothetical protein